MARELLGLLILSSVLLLYVTAQSLGPNRLTCGKRRVKTIHLVQNGIDAKPGHWPWHAAIFHRKGDQLDYACGGSIIDENTILTAAHCVFLVNGLLPVSRISVHLGRVHLKEVSEFVQEHTVQELIVHPGYNSSRFVNDIALIKLTESITMSEFVQPVCLWTMDKNQELIVGKTGTLVGFGLNEQDVVSEQLKQASIGVVDALTCIKSDRLSFANQLTAEMFCGGGQSNVSACNGDSGGGLFFNVEGKWFVRGVVSFIPVRQRTGLCDPSKYTAYADVAKYLGWIDQYIDRRVLVFDTDELEVDYEEKLPLFNLNTCGTKSETVLATGRPAPLPWLGFVLTKENKVKCVVTLISEWYVVSTASCFEKNEKDLRILFGGYEDLLEQKCFERNGTTICAYPTQSRSIGRVVAHPRFSKNTINDNIALIELQSPADTTQPHVKPICLPVTPTLYTNQTENFSVLAFRLTTGTIVDQSVNHVDPDFCKSVHIVAGFAIDNEEKSFCVSVPEEDVANCDSLLGQGTPLQEHVSMVDAGERYVLRGFDLLGLTCAGDSSIPVLYVNVYSYLDWMLYNMRYNEAVNEDEQELIANATLAKWKERQQAVGSEKLKLFNMESCGQNVVEPRGTGSITLIPWIGTLKIVENPVKQNTVPDGLVVLINERYALTSANVFRPDVQWRSIVLGFNHYNPVLEIACTFGVCDRPYQAVEIKQITIHPQYNGTYNIHNIALIELVEPANVTKRYISPICMPLIEEFRNSTPFELVVPSYIYHEQSTQLEPLDPLNCQERFAQQNAAITLNNRSRCAVALDKEAKEPAALKAGAPLQTLLRVGSEKRYFLSGMNSFTDLVNYHNPGYPYLFTDTNAYLDWMLENMQLDSTVLPDSYVEQVDPSPTRNTSRRRLFNFKTCGAYTKGSSANATYETEPWHGFVHEWIEAYNSTLFTRCTVVLVSEWYAIGVASCLKQDAKLWVQFGGYVESDSGDNCWDADGTTICRPKTHRIAVERIIVHPQYNRTGYTDDIALVQLATPADVSQPHVQPICLPILDEVRSYAVSSMATVTFGLAHGSFITSKVDRTRFVPPAECQRRWNGMALRLQIERTKQCNLMVRDSQNECYPVMPGFPLHTTQQLLGEQRHFLRGLLALRPELCSSYYPAIYTDVDVYLDWILDSMDERLGTSKLPYNLTEHLIFIQK
ncbi:ovochymase-2 isoform X1 [Anopheles gambiae]|nr:ovochymase-2 isoform X1 [Anopheles gambiae]XP_061515913.1 ovochymase-2 isoform X1 [Anopheles gambiae]